MARALACQFCSDCWCSTSWERRKVEVEEEEVSNKLERGRKCWDGRKQTAAAGHQADWSIMRQHRVFNWCAWLNSTTIPCLQYHSTTSTTIATHHAHSTQRWCNSTRCSKKKLFFSVENQFRSVQKKKKESSFSSASFSVSSRLTLKV